MVRHRSETSLFNRVTTALQTSRGRSGNEGPSNGSIRGQSQGRANSRTRLLPYDNDPACGSEICTHGTFSPRASCSDCGMNDLIGVSSSEPLHVSKSVGVRSTTEVAEEVAGEVVKDMSRLRLRMKYLSYYFPFFNWITQYRLPYLQGDFVAALTMSSVYIPMALSLASNVAHAPAITGLYAYLFHPLVYALLGSSTMMIVGPEAAGSLLCGAVIQDTLGPGDHEDPLTSTRIVGVVTGLAGAIILVGGITRLGFVDNILSRPFLRGFISAIGVMIFIDQIIPETGLSELARSGGHVSHGSTVDKLVFLVRNVDRMHKLTLAVSFGSFSTMFLFKMLKQQLKPRFPNVVFFPDRFIVVILAAYLTWAFQWNLRGLNILGSVKNSGVPLFSFRWPFTRAHMAHVRSAMSTGFIISLLGFFESTVAAKGLSESNSGVEGMGLSANRELVALGVANSVGGCFGALPAFGGYARSKMNMETGAKSPMSSIMLSMITLVCILFVLPYFYYLPMAVLSSIISMVAYSLIEEAPHDIRFFMRLRAWADLSLMLIIFLATMFYSLYLGIALGMGLSILQIIRHASKPRIQILGRVIGTRHVFDNAETHPGRVELVDGCLIVKIPEPLTFANTGDLKNRLRRLENFGTMAAHPSAPRMRGPEANRNVIFDIHGVTSIDASGTQVLCEIVETYVAKGVRVFFCRCREPETEVYTQFKRSGLIDLCGGTTHFVHGVEDALRMANREESV